MSTARIAKPARRHLAWVPAALLVAWGILAATGMTTTEDSIAATTGAVTVSASVAAEVHLDLDVCTTPNAATMGGSADNETATFTAVALLTSNGDTVLGQCNMTLGTNNNNPTAVTLAMSDARPAGGTGNFLCTSAAGAACSGSDFADTAVGATLAEGAAGMKLSARTCDDASTNTTNFYPIAASSTICVDNTGGAASTLTLQIVADPSATQAAGTYTGQANFNVTAS